MGASQKKPRCYGGAGKNRSSLCGDDWCSKGQRLAAVVVGASPTLRSFEEYVIRLLYYLPMEMTKEELEKLKDFKVYVFEWDVYVKAEDYKEIAIENKKLKEIIKDHQLYEEKLEHRIIEFEELLHWE